MVAGATRVVTAVATEAAVARAARADAPAETVTAAAMAGLWALAAVVAMRVVKEGGGVVEAAVVRLVARALAA